MVLQLSKNDLLEDIFSSKGRVRVLRALVEEGQMHISHLSRRTNMNHSSVDRHCRRLKELMLIREKRYGKIRVFEVDFQEFEIKLKKGYGLDLMVDKVNMR
jgi:DNA-binding transcriptional ArsR family regulator